MDRVRVSGAAGTQCSDKLKVIVGFDAGFLGEAGVSYAGPGAQEWGRLAVDIVARRLRDVHGFSGALRVDVIGTASLFATAIRPHPSETQDVRLHVALRSRSRQDVETLLWEVESLLCCGPAGGGGYRGSIVASVVTKSALIDRALVRPTVEEIGRAHV